MKFSLTQINLAWQCLKKNESNHGLGGEFIISGKSSSDILQINGKGEARKKSDHKVESTVSARPPIRIVAQTLSNQWTIGVHKFGDPRNIHDGGSLYGSYLCVQGLKGKPLFHVFEDEQKEEDIASRDNKDLHKPKLIGRILTNLKSDAQIERTEGLPKFTGDYNHALALLKERLTELRILEDMDAAGRLTIAETVCSLPHRPDDD
ncbi:MAG: hypothetical protein SF002_01635 [Alphaproteobacteria bacterium]|nr:hypothetical protein [Alphaproteobacteria bacterium]